MRYWSLAETTLLLAGMSALGATMVTSAASASARTGRATLPAHLQRPARSSTYDRTTPIPPHQSGAVTLLRPIPRTWRGGVHVIPRQWTGRSLPVGNRPSGSTGRYTVVVRRQRSRVAHPKSASEPHSPRTVLVTQADDHKSVTARVGDTVQLKLRPGLTWTVTRPEGKILQPLGEMPATARFRAVNPGTVQLRAYGRMKARPGQVVAMFVILFQTTVHVAPGGK